MLYLFSLFTTCSRRKFVLVGQIDTGAETETETEIASADTGRGRDSRWAEFSTGREKNDTETKFRCHRWPEPSSRTTGCCSSNTTSVGVGIRLAEADYIRAANVRRRHQLHCLHLSR